MDRRGRGSRLAAVLFTDIVEVARSRLDGIEVGPVRGRQRWVGVAAGVAALAVAGWVVLGGRADVPQAGLSPSATGSTSLGVPSGVVAEIDPDTGRMKQFVPLPLGSQFIDVSHTMTAGLGAVWIVRNEKIVHLDGLAGELLDPVPLPGVVISASYSVASRATSCGLCPNIPSSA